WLRAVMHRLEAGQGDLGDIELLLDLCDNILGRAFCALGDGATSPVTSAIQYFREEFEAGMHTPASVRCPQERSAVFDYVPSGDATTVAGVHCCPSRPRPRLAGRPSRPSSSRYRSTASRLRWAR